MPTPPGRRFWPALRPACALLVLGAFVAVPQGAEAARYKPKAKVTAAPPHAGAAGDTANDPSTGTIGAPGGSGSKDCFVVRKRAFVPGTGYLVKRSTFCN